MVSTEYKRIERLLKQWGEEYSVTIYSQPEALPHPNESGFKEDYNG